LTPDERLRDVAAVLARGLRRLRDRGMLAADLPPLSVEKDSAESSRNGLEVPAGTVLSVHRS
jgi:hypothetical protein